MSTTKKPRPTRQDIGPPAVTKAVMVLLPIALKEKLELKSKRLGISQGRLQAKALEQWLEKDSAEDLVGYQLHELRLGLRRMETRQKLMLEVVLEGMRVLFSLRGIVPEEAQAEHSAEGKRRYEGALGRIVKRSESDQTLVTQIENALFLSQDQEGAHRKEQK
jgi:hypothetical protein